MSGGNCPETPRQKMIGMMYLFLTAMLALNVSGELLQAFKLVDNSIKDATIAVESKNDQLYNVLETAKLANETKVTPTADKANQIREKANELDAHIQELKLLMVHTADGEEATLENYASASNQDVAAQIMITEQGGKRSEELKQLINEYRELLLSMVKPEDETLRKTISTSLSTEPTKSETKGDVIHPWESQKFEHLPLSASFALMSSIQSNVRNSQADIVSYLLREIDEESYKFNKVEPLVIPDSRSIIKGGKYKAKIMMMASDTTQYLNIIVNGKQLTDVENGVGNLELPANSTGKQTWQGTIEMIKPNGDTLRVPINDTYDVTPPSVVISPTKMNVFYQGVENPVEISVPGIPSSALNVNFTNVSHRKNKNEYLVKPKSGTVGKKCVITVSAKMDETIKRIGSQTFRIKRVPDPVATVGGISDGKIRKNVLLAQSSVLASMKDFDFELKPLITGFNVSVLKNGYLVDKSSSNGRFTQEQMELIKGLQRGARVTIDNIKAKNPGDKISRKLGSIVLTLD